MIFLQFLQLKSELFLREIVQLKNIAVNKSVKIAVSGVASRYIPDISGKDSAQETRNHSFCLHFTWNGLFSRSGSGNAVDHFFCFTFHHFLEEGILKASFELRFDQISNFNIHLFVRTQGNYFSFNQNVFTNFRKLFAVPRCFGIDKIFIEQANRQDRTRAIDLSSSPSSSLCSSMHSLSITRTPSLLRLFSNSCPWEEEQKGKTRSE